MIASVRYAILATLVVTITLTSPGRESPDHITRSKVYEMWRTVILYVLSLLALYSLVGSDSGYLGTPSSSSSSPSTTLAAATADNESPDRAEETASIQSLLGRIYEENAAPLDDDGDATANGPGLDDHKQSTGTPTSENSLSPLSTRRKHCQVCNTSPPLRSHHCKECNRCVATFDHHCAFIGVCIGERNHARFLVFVILQFMAFWQCCRVLSSSQFGLWSLITYKRNTMDAHYLLASLYMTLTKSIVYTLTVPAFLVMCIHLFMALSNSTTFEFAKASHLDYMRGMDAMALPFSQGGVCANMRVFFHRDEWFQKFVCRSWSACNHRGQHAVSTPWTPIEWPVPIPESCDSEDWWNNPWRNKYWSCC